MTKPQKTLPGFERFWDRYAYKINRADAFKAWTKGKCEEIADEIIAAIPAYDEHLANNAWLHKANASTWLNGQRWLNEYTPAKPAFNPHQRQFVSSANRYQSREEYLRAEMERAERSFTR